MTRICLGLVCWQSYSFYQYRSVFCLILNIFSFFIVSPRASRVATCVQTPPSRGGTPRANFCHFPVRKCTYARQKSIPTPRSPILNSLWLVCRPPGGDPPGGGPPPPGGGPPPGGPTPHSVVAPCASRRPPVIHRPLVQTSPATRRRGSRRSVISS